MEDKAVSEYRVIIIGGGASGLFLHSLIPSSLLIEKNSVCGLKLLLTGNGSCNITHDEDRALLCMHYYEKRGFVTPALYAFPSSAVREYFSSLKVETYIRSDGKVFPVTNDSRDVRDALLGDGRNILYEAEVKKAEKEENHFTIETAKGKFTSEFLVIATGGMTYPKTGSTGDGYSFARAFGHNVIAPRPALSSISISMETSTLEGVSLSSVTLAAGKKKETGAIVFTRRGIGGPAAENISHWIDGEMELRIFFLPSFDTSAVKKENGKAGIIKTLRRLTALPHSLLLFLFDDIKDKNTASITKDDLRLIEERLTDFNVRVRTDGVNRAMVTSGGVDTREIDAKTMESKIVKGLYFTGEVLDVDGECGGYNLTFAFASAFLASLDIRKKS